MTSRQDSATEPLVSEAGKPADTPSMATPASMSSLHDPSAIGLARMTLPRLELSRLERPRLPPLTSPIGPTIEHEKSETILGGGSVPPTEPPASHHDDAAFDDEDDRPSFARRSLLAASIAVAAVVGIGAGAAGTNYFMHSETAAAPTASVAEETRALRETVVRLSSDLTTLQARIDTSNRSTNTHFAKLADRLDRAEKANVEPNAKLAKIADGLDRLERKTAAPAPTVAAPEVTGSVTAVPKTAARPTELEDWRLREFINGRALVENRNGDMYEVGPGGSIPGLGRVESIKREDGKVVVLTAKGQISGVSAPRRAPPSPPRYMQYRY